MKLRRWYRRVGFHLLRGLSRLLALGGPHWLRRGGEAFGSAHFQLGSAKRRALLAQLETLFPDQAQMGTLPSVLREAYRVNDRAIVEIMAAYGGGLTPAATAGLCRVADLSQLDLALERGRGVVLLGMHMGNGVAMAIHLARLGYPVNVVYRESNKISPHFFRDGIQRQGLGAIGAKPAAAGFRRMLKTLQGNGILFILMDQASKQPGVVSSFLGKQLQMPPGPAELARRSGAAVVPALLEAVDSQWHFRLDPAIILDASRPLEQDVKILAERMESHIRARPQWWTWHQRRWSRHPFAEAREALAVQGQRDS